MTGLTYWGPFVLVVVSNVLYHNIAKWTPITLSPMLGLSITYLISFLLCIAAYVYTGSPFRQDIQELNWASVVWGIVLVGIEFGYIFLYRAGWEISIAPIMINITCAIILIAIGIFVYNESLSLKQGIGILCCFAGLYLIR